MPYEALEKELKMLRQYSEFQRLLEYIDNCEFDIFIDHVESLVKAKQISEGLVKLVKNETKFSFDEESFLKNVKWDDVANEMFSIIRFNSINTIWALLFDNDERTIDGVKCIDEFFTKLSKTNQMWENIKSKRTEFSVLRGNFTAHFNNLNTITKDNNDRKIDGRIIPNQILLLKETIDELEQIISNMNELVAKVSVNLKFKNDYCKKLKSKTLINLFGKEETKTFDA